ncbi:MAG: N-acyl homoserine lactonase family protein [Alphaproteobacteria bacterium]
MTVRLYAMTLGRLDVNMANMMEGSQGIERVPVPAFLVEHPKGRLVYDTGMHPLIQTDPAAHLGETASRFGFDYAPGEEVSGRLEAIDRDPARIDLIVTSHLHFDHAGGNGLIPNADILIQRREWDVAMDPEVGPKWGLHRRDVELGHRVTKVEGEHDVFGDGRVVCIPTHGHTPGHQSLKVRLDDGEVVLTGDACYFCRTLDERRLPARVFDRPAMRESLDRLAALRDGGAKLIFGHDAEFWKSVPQAPAEVRF